MDEYEWTNGLIIYSTYSKLFKCCLSVLCRRLSSPGISINSTSDGCPFCMQCKINGHVDLI